MWQARKSAARMERTRGLGVKGWEGARALLLAVQRTLGSVAQGLAGDGVHALGWTLLWVCSMISDIYSGHSKNRPKSDKSFEILLYLETKAFSHGSMLYEG